MPRPRSPKGQFETATIGSTARIISPYLGPMSLFLVHPALLAAGLTAPMSSVLGKHAYVTEGLFRACIKKTLKQLHLFLRGQMTLGFSCRLYFSDPSAGGCDHLWQIHLSKGS